MQNTRTVFNVITDFLATNPAPEELLAHYLGDLQAQADYLLEHNGEDPLSPEERDEIYDFMRADELMTLLKATVKLKLRKPRE